MDFPEAVLALVREAEAKNPNDIDEAVETAAKKIRKLPEFDSLVDAFVTRAVRELIHDARHNETRLIKKEAGSYDAIPKVSSVGDAVNRAAMSVYLYRIAGRTLGDLLGSELEAIAKNENEIAEGHLFNARLMDRLRKMVPEDKRVREAVKESRLNALFKECEKKLGR